jgi:hypothetical protein
VTSAGSGVPNQTGAKSSVLWNIIKDFQLGAVVTLGNGARSRVAQNSIQYLHGGTSPFATPSSSAEAGLRAAARRNKVRLSTAMTDEGYERAQEGVRRVYGGTAVAGGVGPWVLSASSSPREATASATATTSTAAPRPDGEKFLLAGIIAGGIGLATAADPVGPPGQVLTSENLIAFVVIAMAANDQLKVSFRDNASFFAFAHVCSRAPRTASWPITRA